MYNEVNIIEEYMYKWTYYHLDTGQEVNFSVNGQRPVLQYNTCTYSLAHKVSW